jgi:hypothetical protein
MLQLAAPAALTVGHGVVHRSRVVWSDANAAVGNGSGSGERIAGEESRDTKGGEEHDEWRCVWR